MTYVPEVPRGFRRAGSQWPRHRHKSRLRRAFVCKLRRDARRYGR
jgi:hypothetical protein